MEVLILAASSATLMLLPLGIGFGAAATRHFLLSFTFVLLIVVLGIPFRFSLHSTNLLGIRPLVSQFPGLIHFPEVLGNGAHISECNIV